MDIRESVVDPEEDEGDEDEESQEQQKKKTFGCKWQFCQFETKISKDVVRHIHYHSFHTKIKCHGLNILKVRYCENDNLALLLRP